MVHLNTKWLGRGVAVALAAVFGPTVAPADDSLRLPDEIPAIVATSFPDSYLYGNQTWFRQTGGLFEPFFSSDMKFRNSDFCASLLQAFQLFPLGIFLDAKYITPAQRESLLGIERHLNPRQFRIFEKIKVLSGDQLAGRSIDIKSGDLAASMFPMLATGKVGATSGTLWTVAGQTTDSRVRLRYERMPWQLDLEFRDVSVDRSKMPLVWEMGRGGQDESHQVDALSRAAVLGMLNETWARGFTPAEGFVFLHSLGVAQTRAFRMPKHPRTNEPLFKPFASFGPTDANVVLVASLADLLDAYPPEQFSKRIADLVAVTGRRLSGLGAAEHIFALRNVMRQDLDFRSPRHAGHESPIILRNTTPVTGWFMAKVAERWGVYDTGPAMVHHLSGVRWLDTLRRGQYVVDSGIPATAEISRKKLIGLSNFSRAAAESDPDYLATVLIGVYSYYSNSVTQAYPDQSGVLLDQTRFVINSSHSEVIRQASAIPRGKPEPFNHVDVYFEVETHDGQIQLSPRIKMSVGPGLIFDRESILKLIADRPALAREAARAIRKGNWQTLHLVSDPVGF